MNVSYGEAAAEVLDILQHIEKKDVEKISTKFLNFLKIQSDKNYKPDLDHTKSIKEMKLNPKTKALLGLIYLNYWADDDGKKNFNVKLMENEKKYQQELNRKYNADNLFNRNGSKIEEDVSTVKLPTVIEKETFWNKVLYKIKLFFRR